jgi:hypothetical protein
MSFFLYAILTTSQKVLFTAVIPEVLNRESILFKKLRAPGFPPSPTVGALSAGMTTFYESININCVTEKPFMDYS